MRRLNNDKYLLTPEFKIKEKLLKCKYPNINFKVLTSFNTLIVYTIYELKHLNLKQISTNNLNKKYYML